MVADVGGYFYLDMSRMRKLQPVCLSDGYPNCEYDAGAIGHIGKDLAKTKP